MTVWISGVNPVGGFEPAGWLRPSRAQSGRMAMRMEARRIGPGHATGASGVAALAVQEPPNPCAQYHRPRPRQSPVLDLLAEVARDMGQSMARACEDPRLLEHFEMLPADVFKVEADKQMIALYWGRAWRAAVLQDIAAVLKALA